ncbi:HpcH/HpaI aldolase family protein [Lacisediminihabitans profunda]|uniref:2,4-dihydroxyhept-2-ene-1,7-dioic acid aldolase n=1 Tax=Lacisediminihabitans profunda TaxID=2594790 RepID=A0A5C8ULM7_9MICO|nr:aldolase/citrate lyase family protein [Lacisediminihabitans profunda]TXN28754.1 2,4-dihydroxyhept-2-ene-1,7-dioic acid aldolase [Lacisediminihabitans profunda]
MNDTLIEDGRVALGLWVKLPLVESIEIAAASRYDFVVIDLEHSTINTERAAQQIAMARALRILPLVRLPLAARSDVGRLLDAGAAGIVFPHIDSVAEAVEAVRLCRFPPMGERGVGPTSRAGGWGLMDLGEYLAPGAGQPYVIAQIETAHAVSVAAEIGNTEGVDGLLIGRTDLTVSMGRQAGPDGVDRLVATYEAAAGSGIALGTAVGNSEGVDLRLYAKGYRFVVVSNDVSLLALAATTSASSARSRLHRD